MDLGSLVAWVAAADEAGGRAVALALAAGGARVLVTGTNERAIAECVGEIAHGGGKARHFVGEAVSQEGRRACADAAVTRFGALHVAVVAGASDGEARAWTRELPSVRVVTLSASRDEAASVSAVLAEIAAIAAD
jgi:NAD(P)-dependent dehydrogenase (short-subunit alcohol dehydrogenase family)